MRKLLFILASIFILLSCGNNPTESIKNETDLNTFITTKLAGTWKVEGKLEGTEFWQFKPFILSSMWGTKYDIVLKDILVKIHFYYIKLMKIRLDMISLYYRR